MKAGHRMRGLVFLSALAIAPAAHAQTPPTEPQRRPQGPTAGPVIKLPPGSGAADERAPAPGAKDEAAPLLPQRWEYCVIQGFRYHEKSFSISSSRRVPAAYVRYLPEGSEEIEGGTEEEALGNALVKLGDDGWELTAIRTDLHLKEGDGVTSSVYFFKRPKRPE